MRELLDLPRLQALDADAAAAALAARVADPTGLHDFALLDAWLALSPAHEEAWEQVQSMLDLFSMPVDDETSSRLHALADAPGASGSWTRPWWAAAAAMLLLMSGGAYFLAGRLSHTGASSKEQQTYVATAGQTRVVKLEDGSEMTLRPETAVSLSFADDDRRLSLLKGGAYFKVRHDVSRPFIVTADGHNVTALGTQFDVALSPGRFQVILVEGKVSVGETAGTGNTILMPGQMLVQNGAGQPVISNVVLQKPDRPAEKLANFHDETLIDVANYLNRFTVDKLIVRDPIVARMRISGTFRTGDIARFGRALAEIHPVRIVRAGDHLWEIISVKRKKNLN